MKFTHYLNENIVEDLVPMLKKDCNKFLKEAIRSLRAGEFVYRGAYFNMSNGVYGRAKSRLDNRNPMSTSKEVHDMLNEAFQKKFGWPVRNGVFTGDIERTAGYGSGWYLFFPIGNYKYCWSPEVGDLFAIVNHLKYYYEKIKRYSKDSLLAIADLSDFYRNVYSAFRVEFNTVHPNPDDIPKAIKVIVDSYTNKNLNDAIEMGHEISFNCKEYYLVESQYRSNITIGLKDEV